ncbi:MAG: 5-(carboxyamino)imidazole ribonucleotide synthase [Elainellaceae cyanobacterium]
MRVGVIGGGQLARMMGSAADALGLDLIVQTPSPHDPAVAIASDHIFASVDDAAATARLAQRCDVITFENEFIDIPALKGLPRSESLFRPRLEAIRPLVDKLEQREYLRSLELPVPRFVALNASTALKPGGVTDPATSTSLSFPLVLKARRHGYDGKGTYIVHDLAHLHRILTPEAIAANLWMIEEFIPFERELAVMVARGQDGAIATYPVVESVQIDQVCRRVIAGIELPSTVSQTTEAIAQTLLQSLDVVGIFGVELFLTPDNRVLINEIAPRTHNSGHYTIEACITSQFEQQLRAVCGLPLGDAALQGPALMVNLLGYETAEKDYLPQRQQLAQIPQAAVHWYGKPQSRPGRKLGHVTVRLDGSQTVAEQADAISRHIESIWYPSTSIS